MALSWAEAVRLEDLRKAIAALTSTDTIYVKRLGAWSWSGIQAYIGSATTLPRAVWAIAQSRAMAQHDILVRSLQKVAGDAKGENGGWKIKLIIFVGGTSG